MAKHEAMDMQTVADLLGVSVRMVNNYINQKGLPSQGSGRTRSFVWSEVLEWYIRYRVEMEMDGGNDGNEEGEFDESASDSSSKKPEDLRGAMLRKTKAEADLKQLALSKQRSEVVTIVDAKARLDRMLGNLRAKMLSIAPKLANRVEALKTRTDKEAAIKEEMESLCRELSTGEIVGSAEPTTETIEEISAAGDPLANPSNVMLLRNYAELLVDYDSL